MDADGEEGEDALRRNERRVEEEGGGGREVGRRALGCSNELE